MNADRLNEVQYVKLPEQLFSEKSIEVNLDDFIDKVLNDPERVNGIHLQLMSEDEDYSYKTPDEEAIKMYVKKNPDELIETYENDSEEAKIYSQMKDLDDGLSNLDVNQWTPRYFQVLKENMGILANSENEDVSQELKDVSEANKKAIEAFMENPWK